MGRIRLTLAILVTVIGVAGLLVCAVTQDRWLGVSDLTIHYRGIGAYWNEHVYALHNGIYFDVEFEHDYFSPNPPLAWKRGDRHLHLRGGVTPSEKTLPTYWGFSRAGIGGVDMMANQSQMTTQWSFPVWPIFLICLVPVPIIIIRAIPKWRAAGLGLPVRCKYNLSGNRSGVCPECGLPIQSST